MGARAHLIRPRCPFQVVSVILATMWLNLGARAQLWRARTVRVPTLVYGAKAAERLA